MSSGRAVRLNAIFSILTFLGADVSRHQQLGEAIIVEKQAVRSMGMAEQRGRGPAPFSSLSRSPGGDEVATYTDALD
jgi:hypothetical protein